MSLPMFLNDKRFLKYLDALPIKEQFIRITVLNWEQQPIQEIQGYVINGNINLDGSSSMRRTATLTIFAEQKQNNLANVDHLFAVNKKCKLQIGIVNNVSDYIYQEKDDLTVKPVIINYKKKYGNIVWFPLGIYVMFNPSLSHSMEGVQISMQLKDKMCLLNGDLGGQIHSSIDFAHVDELVTVDSVSVIQKGVLIYDIIIQLVNHWGNEQLSKIIISEVPLQIKMVVKWMGQEQIYLCKVGNGQYILTQSPLRGVEQPVPYSKYQDVGFKYEDFIYPSELVCNIGETVTSVLDKIINIMGNYEYFYDVEGNFVFRQKQNYLNMTNTAYWAKEGNITADLPTDVYQADTYRLSKVVYNFSHNEYTTAYNNSLNYNNLKNDFVVWGLKNKGGNSAVQLPCRFHLAIDKKPRNYEQNIHKIALYKDSFDTVRAIAIPPNVQIKKGSQVRVGDTIVTIIETDEERRPIDWREEIYYQMLESEILGTDTNTERNNSYFQYYAELKQEFPKIFDLQKGTWKKETLEHPQQINYYLDFIDEDSQLGQYSVNNIGRRSKIVDGSDGINCVFEPQIPDIVYVNASEMTSQQYSTLIQNLTLYGQKWTQVSPGIDALFSKGGELNSCFQKIKDLLYQYTHFNNTISITTLPIYYLEPNTRITVEDDPAGIYGDYIIQSISLPLDISSTMTINAYKAQQKI